MYGTRELLAIVLSLGLGAVLITFPGAFIRIQLVGRGPRDPGRYGEDWDPPRTYTTAVRAVGLLAAGAGAYIAALPHL